MRRINKNKPLIQVRPTCGKLPELEARQADGVGAHHLHEDVTGGVTQLSQLLSKPSRLLKIGSSKMIHKLAPQRKQQRARPVQD